MEKELQELAQAIEKMYAYVPPPPGGLAAGRRRLLEAATRRQARPATLLPRQRFALRFAAALAALLLATFAVGGGVAWAASESLPGQALYPLKLEMENVQLALAQTYQAQVELALRFADERVEEIEALAGSGAVPAGTAERLELHLQYALRRAAEAPPEETPGLLARIAERTQAQLRVLERVRQSAGNGAMAQLEHAWRVCYEGNQAAAAGLADPQTFRWRYQWRQGEPEGTVPPSATPPATESQPTRTPGGPWRTPGAGEGNMPTVTPGNGQGAPGSGGATPMPAPTENRQPTPGGGQPPSGEGQGEPGGGSGGSGSGNGGSGGNESGGGGQGRK